MRVTLYRSLHVEGSGAHPALLVAPVQDLFMAFSDGMYGPVWLSLLGGFLFEPVLSWSRS